MYSLKNLPTWFKWTYKILSSLDKPTRACIPTYMWQVENLPAAVLSRVVYTRSTPIRYTNKFTLRELMILVAAGSDIFEFPTYIIYYMYTHIRSPGGLWMCKFFKKPPRGSLFFDNKTSKTIIKYKMVYPTSRIYTHIYLYIYIPISYPDDKYLPFIGNSYCICPSVAFRYTENQYFYS